MGEKKPPKWTRNQKIAVAAIIVPVAWGIYSTINCRENNSKTTVNQGPGSTYQETTNNGGVTLGPQSTFAGVVGPNGTYIDNRQMGDPNTEKALQQSVETANVLAKSNAEKDKKIHQLERQLEQHAKENDPKGEKLYFGISEDLKMAIGPVGPMPDGSIIHIEHRNIKKTEDGRLAINFPLIILPGNKIHSNLSVYIKPIVGDTEYILAKYTNGPDAVMRVVCVEPDLITVLVEVKEVD